MACRQWKSLYSHTGLLTVLAIVVSYHSHTAMAGLERECPPGGRYHYVGFCGARLSDIVQNLCRVLAARSREMQGFMKRSASKSEVGLSNGLQSILLQKRDAFSFLPSKSKRQDEQGRSIICECCYHQCNVYELAQYCPIANGRSLIKRSQLAFGPGSQQKGLEDSYS